MNQKMYCFTVLLVTLAVLAQQIVADSYCEDWTLCQRVRCAGRPDPCPAEEPYVLLGECGCCEYCSEEPREGPCGVCGVDVVCKEDYPICSEGQIVSIDYCGCCRVCKTVTGLGTECATDGSSSTVCEAGLECDDGICSEPDTE